MAEPKYDFSGYATRNGLKCSDGRTILKDAFKHQDGMKVPIVWQHLHSDPSNVLGHAILENREEGVYCYGTFNTTEKGQNAKALVEHGDVSALSIYANQLEEKAKHVSHGRIIEVSLVLSGANPGAWIDNLSFAHSDGTYTEDETEVISSPGEGFLHAECESNNSGKENNPGYKVTKKPPETDISHAETSDKTVQEVFDTFNEEQKTVVYAMIAKALSDEDDEADNMDDDEGSMGHSANGKTVQEVFDTFNEEQKTVVYALVAKAFETKSAKHSSEEGQENTIKHYDEGDNNMHNNVFDKKTATQNENVLTHEQLGEIIGDAEHYGSLKKSFIAHATDYGFNPTDILFPDAQYTNKNGPEVYKREDSWVTTLLAEATHTPFSRIKTVVANITGDAARAKGYVTGNLKNEEVIPLLKRTTTPTTIYKKQKLDRDDMVDITDFDVVIWLKAEMRGMLNEELARAILIGDGRNVSDEDKVNEQNIRPIATDNPDMYIHRAEVANDSTSDDIIDEFIKIRKYYKGSGNPTLYTGTDLLTDMLLIKDTLGRRIYKDVNELASVLRVSKIVECEVLNGATRKVSDSQTNTILGIVVNMKDYTIGSDKGGQVAMFDDFDIDYNQYKYLLETRVSGALTKPKSALIVEKKPAGI